MDYFVLWVSTINNNNNALLYLEKHTLLEVWRTVLQQSQRSWSSRVTHVIIQHETAARHWHGLTTGSLQRLASYSILHLTVSHCCCVSTQGCSKRSQDCCNKTYYSVLAARGADRIVLCQPSQRWSGYPQNWFEFWVKRPAHAYQLG